jgi:hypothetical protein
MPIKFGYIRNSRCRFRCLGLDKVGFKLHADSQLEIVDTMIVQR